MEHLGDLHEREAVGEPQMHRLALTFQLRPAQWSDGPPITAADVHFTWRTPWNASLSVGATNLLHSGTGEGGASENKLTDPCESVYGRIPYVRYQQDL